MNKKFLLLASLVIPMLMFAYTAYNSYGYDDEYFNIDAHVESYGSAWELARDHLSGRFVDIHPIGSYLINYILIKALGSWPMVRVAGALLAAFSMWLYWLHIAAKDRKNSLTVLFAWVCMCLNPTLLLWCTSVRWYTYFFPLVCILGMLLSSPDFLKGRKYLFWGIYFTAVSLMLYIETNAVIIIILSFILLLLQRRKNFADEWKVIFCFGLLSLLFVSRQIYLVLAVIYPTVKGSGEFYSMIASVAGGGQNFLCGHAVMPVSVPGIILIAANCILFLVFIINIKSIASSYPNELFMLSYAGIILTRIGGKIRNYVSLSALQGNFTADIFSCIKSRVLKASILGMYIIGTVWGIYNVTAHTDTTRGTWNTPYRELLAFIEEVNPEKDYLAVSHNPVFNYHAKLLGFSVLNAGTGAASDWYEKLNAHEGRVIVLRTYRGSMPYDDFEKFNSYIDSRKIITSKSFGYDKFAGFKRRFDKLYPNYYAEILVTE